MFPWEFKSWEFYFIQVIERHKDNPDKSWLNGWNSCRVVKSFSIRNQDQLDKYRERIIEYSSTHNARVYIHPSRRSNNVIATMMIKMLSEYLLESKHSLHRLYESACGTSKGVTKLWIIDCDWINMDEVNLVCDHINSYNPWRSVEYVLPTVNGFHIITKPFDCIEFSKKYSHEIHKNNPTLLYY